MNILIIGDEERKNELLSKLNASNLRIDYYERFGGSYLSKYDVIFDLNFDENSESLNYLACLENTPIIVGAVKRQLADIVYHFRSSCACHLIGMNTLPAFINRSKMEMSLLDKDDLKILERVCRMFQWDYRLVEDRVGMVTPRVICMIINEACYTLQEGTASIEDIDRAMKLGTNYPYGPFEWADRIGIKNVYETLKAIYNDTRDERYKTCPLLKTKYLKKEWFYNHSAAAGS